MRVSAHGAVPPGAAAPETPLAELVGITKTFGAVVANDSVTLRVAPGEVLALLGENGAGKSTLTRILFGLSQADSGEILIDGVPTRMSSPSDAMAAGIGRINRADARSRVLAAAERIGVAVNPDAIVETLSVGERQRVEIVKALFHDCRLLILDEPTAVLVPQDVALLFDSIRRLSRQGMGVIFISHKLHEVVEIADRVSILRRGRVIASVDAAGLQPRQIAALMVGTELADTALIGSELADPEAGVPGDAFATAIPEGAATPTIPDTATGAPTALHITGVTLKGAARPLLDNLTLTVRSGEIVGIAGVSGNGQTELVSVLCGMTAATTGTIAVGGTDITTLGVAERIRAGLGRLTEDRRGSVVPGLSVEQNLVLEDLDQFRRGPFLSRRRIRQHVRTLMDRFDIRANPTDPISSLSGGNMQKVLLARAISRGPTALVASQPTRGLDVGACDYVYSQLRALRAGGAGVLLVSEDLDELTGICDRIVVLFSGGIIGEVDAASASREQLGLLMTGHTGNPVDQDPSSRSAS